MTLKISSGRQQHLFTSCTNTKRNMFRSEQNAFIKSFFMAERTSLLEIVREMYLNNMVLEIKTFIMLFYCNMLRSVKQ